MKWWPKLGWWIETAILIAGWELGKWVACWIELHLRFV